MYFLARSLLAHLGFISLALAACGGAVVHSTPDSVRPPADAGTGNADAGTGNADAGTANGADASPAEASAGPEAAAQPSSPYPAGVVAAGQRMPGANNFAVAIYPPNPSYMTQPLGIVSGSWGACENLGGVAFDTAGNLYVACEAIDQSPGMGPGAIYVFASGTLGESAPIRTITTGATPLLGGLVVDANGVVYVSSITAPSGPDSILVARPSDTTAADTVWGASVGMAGFGLALDTGSSNLYTTNFSSSAPFPAVLEYALGAGASAAARPIGSSTDMGIARGVTVDGTGNVYVAGNLVYDNPNPTDGRVVVYSSDGSVERVITGSQTNLGQPMGIALDAAGQIYVEELDMVLIFSPGATGNASPSTVFPGGGGEGLAVLR